MRQVHGGQDQADTPGAVALQAIEDGEQVAVKPALSTVFEKRVGIVQEDDGRSVLLSGFENMVHAFVEIVRAGNEGSVDQKEFALQPMGQGTADRGLARS